MFKRFFYSTLFASLMLNSLLVFPSERAEHQSLKKFLDCQIKGKEDCKLKKPAQKVVKKDLSEKTKDLKEKKRTKSQKFIFGPYENRSRKATSNAR